MASPRYHRTIKEGDRYFIINRDGYVRPQGFYTREAAEKIMAMSAQPFLKQRRQYVKNKH